MLAVFLLVVVASPVIYFTSVKTNATATTFVFIAYGLLVAYPALQVVIYSLPRWLRERALTKHVGHKIMSVYLSPQLLGYLTELGAEKYFGSFTESVSVVFKDDAIQFWSRAGTPQFAGSISLRDIHELLFDVSSEDFKSAILHVGREYIPLFPASGILGLSRTRSRALFESISGALDAAGLGSAVIDTA